MENNQKMNRDQMTGKVCLVTGATAGIGKITASALAARGAELVIHGRNRQKTEIAVEEIKANTGNPAVSYLLADFSDLDQVRKMAEDFQTSHDRLHLLVNNAGAFFNKKIRTSYGVEMTLLVNHLAPFLLTNLLLDILKNSAPGRIVNISSDGHRQGNLDFNDLEFNKGYFGMKAYGRSKLANILFSNELARRLKGSGVTANALHPGHIATDIWKTNFGLFGPTLKWLMSKIALSPEAGAESAIYLASSPEVEGISGKYFNKTTIALPSAEAADELVSRELWDVSLKLTDLTSN